MEKTIYILSRALHVFLGTGATCRFEPTCSQYFSIAQRKHGVLRGLVLFLFRLFRCHPWGSCGIDAVPETFGEKFNWRSLWHPERG